MDKEFYEKTIKEEANKGMEQALNMRDKAFEVFDRIHSRLMSKDELGREYIVTDIKLVDAMEKASRVILYSNDIFKKLAG